MQVRQCSVHSVLTLHHELCPKKILGVFVGQHENTEFFLHQEEKRPAVSMAQQVCETNDAECASENAEKIIKNVQIVRLTSQPRAMSVILKYTSVI